MHGTLRLRNLAVLAEPNALPLQRRYPEVKTNKEDLTQTIFAAHCQNDEDKVSRPRHQRFNASGVSTLAALCHVRKRC